MIQLFFKRFGARLRLPRLIQIDGAALVLTSRCSPTFPKSDYKCSLTTRVIMFEAFPHRMLACYGTRFTLD